MPLLLANNNIASYKVAAITNNNKPQAIGYNHWNENAVTNINTTTAKAMYKRLVKKMDVNMFFSLVISA